MRSNKKLIVDTEQLNDESLDSANFLLDEYVQSSGINRLRNSNVSSLQHLASNITSPKKINASNGIYVPNFNQNPYQYGYPMPIPQQPLAADDVNLRLSLEKQNMLLKNLSKQMDNASSYPKRKEQRSSDSRDYERKIKEIEKDNEIKMELMKHQQQLELLTNIKSKEQEKSSQLIDPNSKFFPGSGVISLIVLGKLLMQQNMNSNPFAQMMGANPIMNYNTNPMQMQMPMMFAPYPEIYNPYG